MSIICVVVFFFVLLQSVWYAVNDIGVFCEIFNIEISNENSINWIWQDGAYD